MPAKAPKPHRHPVTPDQVQVVQVPAKFCESSQCPHCAMVARIGGSEFTLADLEDRTRAWTGEAPLEHPGNRKNPNRFNVRLIQ